MTRYDGQLSRGSVRLLAAFDALGVGRERIADPAALTRAIENLGGEQRRWLIREMIIFSQAYGRYARKTTKRVIEDGGHESLAALARLVSGHVLVRPVYYLWRRP